MEIINLIEIPIPSEFKLESFVCKKHRQPIGAICSSMFCDHRLLCNECMKEHDVSHFRDIILSYAFSCSYILNNVNQFLKERIPILQQHEKTKIKMKDAFKEAFEQFRADILMQLEEFEYYISEVIDESTHYMEDYERLQDHTKTLLDILSLANNSGEFNENAVQDYLNEYKAVQRTIDCLKKDFNYEQLHIILTNSSNEFLQDLSKRYNEFKNTWTKGLNLTKPHELGSFLVTKPRLLQTYQDKIQAIAYSSQVKTLAVLEGFYRIHFYGDLYNLEKQFFRLGFSKLEDFLNNIKWGDNGTLLICNNETNWVKLHYPSRTYSAEISTQQEGAIKKFFYFTELNSFVVATEYYMICYRAHNTFMNVYYKVYLNCRMGDICLLKEENEHLIAIGNVAGYIIIHDVVKRKEKNQFKAHRFGVVAMKYWKEEKVFLTSGQEGELKLWKSRKEKYLCLRSINFEFGYNLTNFILLPSNGWMISIYNNMAFILYDIKRNKRIGVKKVSMPIVSSCFIEECNKLIFGMEKGLYEIQL